MRCGRDAGRIGKARVRTVLEKCACGEPVLPQLLYLASLGLMRTTSTCRATVVPSKTFSSGRSRAAGSTMTQLLGSCPPSRWRCAPGCHSHRLGFEPTRAHRRSAAQDPRPQHHRGLPRALRRWPLRWLLIILHHLKDQMDCLRPHRAQQPPSLCQGRRRQAHRPHPQH